MRGTKGSIHGYREASETAYIRIHNGTAKKSDIKGKQGQTHLCNNISIHIRTTYAYAGKQGWATDGPPSNLEHASLSICLTERNEKNIMYSLEG